MASTFSANPHLYTNVTEILGGDDVPAGSQIIHNQYDDNITLTASSTPNITGAAFETIAMSAGSTSIDLTSLLLNGTAVSFSGKKLRTLKIKALPGNGANITIVKGASNGYTGLGSSFNIVLKPGQAFEFYDAGAGTAVSSSVKTLDVTGAGTDGFQLSATAGD